MGLPETVVGSTFAKKSADVALLILLLVSALPIYGLLSTGSVALGSCHIAAVCVQLIGLFVNQNPSLAERNFLFQVLAVWLPMLLSVWWQRNGGFDWLVVLLLCSYLLVRLKTANLVNGAGLIILLWIRMENDGLVGLLAQLLPLLVIIGLANLISTQFGYLHHALAESQELDLVTGCAGRKYLRNEMCKALGLSQRYHLSMSAVALKIEGMQEQIEQRGHQVFDVLLVELTQVWSSRLRNTDTLCRYSEAIFVVLLPNTTAENAMLLAQDLVLASEAYEFSDRVQVTISFRVAEHDGLESEDAWFNRLLK